MIGRSKKFDDFAADKIKTMTGEERVSKKEDLKKAPDEDITKSELTPIHGTDYLKVRDALRHPTELSKPVESVEMEKHNKTDIITVSDWKEQDWEE